MADPFPTIAVNAAMLGPNLAAATTSWSLSSGMAAMFVVADTITTVAGTGAALAQDEIVSPVIAVTPGTTYELSSFIDAAKVSGTQLPYVTIGSPDLTTSYLTMTQAAGLASVVARSWTAPAGVSQVVLVATSNLATLASGGYITWTNVKLRVGQVLDLSGRLLVDSPFTTTRGRQYATNNVDPGTATLLLDNNDGIFTPGTTTGPYTGSIRPAVEVDIAVTPPGASAATVIFDGRAQGWLSSWPGGAAPWAVCQLTLTDISGRFARRTLDTSVRETVMAWAPSLYFPLDDAQGSSSAQGYVPGQPAATVDTNTGGTVAFGASVGIAGDTGTGALFTATAATKNPGARLQLPEAGLNMTEGTVGFEFSTTNTDHYAYLANLQSNTGVNQLGIYLANSSGSLSVNVFVYNSDNVEQVSLTAGTINPDNSPHTLILGWQTLGGTIKLYATLDGAATVTSSATATGSWAPGYVYFGGNPQAYGFTGTMSHAFVLPRALPPKMATDFYWATTGFTGDLADARIGRLLAWNGFYDALALDPGLALLGAWSPSGSTALNELQLTSAADAGVFFIGQGGTPTFRNRQARYNPAAGVSIDASAEGVNTNLEFSVDDTLLVNTAKVTGATVTVQRANQASVAEYGEFLAQIQTTLLDPIDVAERAAYEGMLFGTPHPRIGTLTLDPLTNPALWTVILGSMEIGQPITITNLPPNAPAASMAFFVEKVSHSAARHKWEVSYELSPTRAYQVLEVSDTDTATDQLDQGLLISW